MDDELSVREIATAYDDGPGYYPDSCCEYVQFEVIEIQHIFGMSREREFVIQQDIKRASRAERAVLIERLHQVQRVIIWLAHNAVHGVHVRRGWRERAAKHEAAKEAQLDLF